MSQDRSDPPGGPLGRLGGDLVDGLRLAHRLERIRSSPAVPHAAFHEDRLLDAVAAGDPTALLADLEAAVEQLPAKTCGREATVVAQVLEKQTAQHRGGVAIGELLPAILARLNIKATEEHK